MNRVKNYLYAKQNLIGQGAAGSVYKGINQQNGQNIAIKIMDMNKIDNQVTHYLLNCQKQALTSINNPYVLRAIQIVQTQSECLIITPLCSGGTLKQLIKSKGKLPEQEALLIFIKLLRGYYSIKQKGFVHRDIKSSNVMFRNGEPVIIDFGYCQKINSKKPRMFYNVGSPSYMSPQAYYKTLYGQKSDIWALGIVLFQMLQGFTIDHGQPIDRYFSSLLKHGFAFHSKLSQSTMNLVRTILNPNFHQRPSVQSLIQTIQRMIFTGNNNVDNQNPKTYNNQHQANHHQNKISLKDSQRKAQQAQFNGQPKANFQQAKRQHLNNQKHANINLQSAGNPVQNNSKLQINQNFIKLSESIYRPESSFKNHSFNPPNVQFNLGNGKNINNQFSLPSQPQQMNFLDVQSQQKKQNYNNMNGMPVFNQFIPSQNNGVQQNFVHFQNQVRNPEIVRQSLIVPNLNFNQASSPVVMSLKHPTQKLGGEYKSMIDPQKLTQNNQACSLENNKNMKVCHSNIFNVESILTIQPNRNQHQNMKVSLSNKQPMQQFNLLANTTLIDSVNISNGNNLSMDNNLIRINKPNQIVQSLIINPNQNYSDRKQNINQVHKSIIVQPQSHQVQNFQQNYQNNFHDNRNFTQMPNMFAQNLVETNNRRVNVIQTHPRVYPIENHNHNWLSNQGNLHVMNQNKNLFVQNNSRPLSPVATQRSSMKIHDQIMRPTNNNNANAIYGNQRNFMKKAEPYFHMNIDQNFKQSDQKQVQVLQRPQPQNKMMISNNFMPLQFQNQTQFQPDHQPMQMRQTMPNFPKNQKNQFVNYQIPHRVQAQPAFYQQTIWR